MVGAQRMKCAFFLVKYAKVACKVKVSKTNPFVNRTNLEFKKTVWVAPNVWNVVFFLNKTCHSHLKMLRDLRRNESVDDTIPVTNSNW